MLDDLAAIYLKTVCSTFIHTPTLWCNYYETHQQV